MLYPIQFFDETYDIIIGAVVPNIEPNRYWISNYGRAFDTRADSTLQVYTDANNRNFVILSTGNGDVMCYLDYLVAMTFVPGDNKMPLQHKDGFTDNDKASNLEWGKPKAARKITDEQAKTICKCIERRMRIQEILEVVGLEDTERNRAIISDIKRGKSFASISKNYSFNPATLRPRDFSTKEVHLICSLLQNDPNMRYSDIIKVLGYNDLTPNERRNMMNKIGCIKLRKHYTDISCNYIW